MASPSGHTHRLPSVEKGREPDVTEEGTRTSGPYFSHDTFFWGVATSGYQAEGGYNGPDEPLNNWAWAERQGDVVPSGRTADFWTLASEDFGRCRDMGLNAFRMSVEWSRVQPTTELGPKDGQATDPPPFDERALYSYAQRIADCRAHGLEPIITLHHFVYPAWLGLDGWLKRETLGHFLTFVRHTIGYLLRTLPNDFGCAPPRWFITINEPNLQAFNHYLYRIFPSGRIGLEPTVQCLGLLFEAHVGAYRLIHELYAGSGIKPMVSFNNYASDLYWSDNAMIDVLFSASRGVPIDGVRKDLMKRAHAFDTEFNAAKLFPLQGPRYFLGQWLKHFHHLLARRAFSYSAWDSLLELLYERPDEVPLDYIAFDYYDPFIAHALRWPSWQDFDLRKRSFRDWVLESVASKWWDWRMLPEGLAFFVRHLARYGLPLIIAENGMALRRLPDNRPFERRDNLNRSRYLREHVRMVSRLVEHGQPLIGYLHWSLVDNYEWGSFAPRFGLFSLDYTVYPTRHAVDATGDNPSATYSHEIRESRAQLAAAARRSGKKTLDGAGPPPATSLRDSNISTPSSVKKL